MTTRVPASMVAADVATQAELDAVAAAKADASATVNLTGNQTIAGTKTFSSQPVLPQALTFDTAKASTSGTSVDFTGIPSWARIVRVMFLGVSTNGTSDIMVRLGTSGGFVATGYLGSVGTSASFNTISTGFSLFGATAPAATTVFHGMLTMTRMTGNTWVAHSIIGFSDTGGTRLMGGSIALADVLTQIRVTTAGGTDAFDAGSINIMYE